MIIHKTQNLNFSKDKYRSKDSLSTENTRTLKCSNFSLYSRNNIPQDTFKYSLSFKGKKQIVKQIIKSANKTFTEKVADSKVVTKTLGSDFFNGILEKTSKEEVLVNSISALGICGIMRPATLLACSSKKDKDNSKYAATHAMSSGLWGLIVPLLFIKPVTNGIGHSMKNMNKYFSVKTLKKMYPHLDLKSINNGIDKAGKGIRKTQDEWKDITGRRFSADIQDVKNIFVPKHISEISKDTLQNQIPNIDLQSITDSNGIKTSANKWIDKNGQKIKPDFNSIFICVTDLDKKDYKYYPLKHVSQKILEEVYPELDVNTITGQDKKRLTPDKWLQKNGKQFNFDLDSVYLSSARDSSETIPYITGHYQKDKTGQMQEVYYQKNGISKNDTGTPITTEMIEAGKINTIKMKLLGWFPELLLAYPKAVATIAILPILLKKCFGIEKKDTTSNNTFKINEKNNSPSFKSFIQIATSKDTDKPTMRNSLFIPQTNKTAFTSNSYRPSFKGNDNAITKFFAKYYSENLLNSDKFDSFAKTLGSLNCGDVTKHLQTLGSAITSSVYMKQTLHNKHLEKKERKTLAINQGLVFGVSTAMAYTLDKAIVNTNKKIESKYIEIQEKKILDKTVKINPLKRSYGNRLGGLRTLISLLTFTMIYRYISPVVITPVANWIGRKLNSKNNKRSHQI